MSKRTIDRQRLRSQIVQSLRAQGFTLKHDRIVAPENISKDQIRAMHSTAVLHRISMAQPQLARYESRLLDRFACGQEINPDEINPMVIEVTRGSEDELLFRYSCLHWSIPVSSGYGRRLRFLVVDRFNGKLIGLFGLCDPVFSLAARDAWIGWSRIQRAERLKCVMDAFVLGAVPPYSSLLCGKLIAMLVASEVVRDAFRRKYSDVTSLISNRPLDTRLALVTTTSALGRSSIYNRIRFRDRTVYQSVGFTRGSGEFHFANGLYAAVRDHANEYCEATAKQPAWGSGFRSRREVVKKCLADVGLSSDLVYHGVQREIFCVPLARNSAEFLRCDHNKLYWYKDKSEDIWSYFRDRWLMPRVKTTTAYRDFQRDSLTLWRTAK